jgi:hypothetical protein
MAWRHVIPDDAPMERQVGVRSRGVGRAGGRRSGSGSVGSRGWFCLGAASLGVGAGGWVMAQPGQDDQVQAWLSDGPRAVEPNPDRLAGGGRDRRGAAQHRKRRVSAAAARMRPGTQHRAATIGPTPQRPSSSGRQARTRVVWRGCARRSPAPMPGCGGPGSAGWPRWRWSRCPRRPAGAAATRADQLVGGQARSRSRSTSGAAVTSACSCRWHR